MNNFKIRIFGSTKGFPSWKYPYWKRSFLHDHSVGRLIGLNVAHLFEFIWYFTDGDILGCSMVRFLHVFWTCWKGEPSSPSISRLVGWSVHLSFVTYLACFTSGPVSSDKLVYNSILRAPQLVQYLSNIFAVAALFVFNTQGRKIINPSAGYPPDEIRFVVNERRAPFLANDRRVV